MAENGDALQNPFSPEKAWLTYRENMTEAARLRDEIRQATESGEGNERETLLKATEALGRLTDNTILKRIVRKALEERDRACEKREE
jgi:hypothetical protein